MAPLQGHLYCILVLIEIVAHHRCAAITCYECRNEFGSCNEGRCSGHACVKIEQAKEGQRSVEKGCVEINEDMKCTEVRGIGHVDVQRCTCLFDFCNGDEQLEQAGIDSRNSASSDRSKRTQSDDRTIFGLTANHLIMIVFLCLFVTGSFSLLIMNTVCVHLC